MLPMKDMFYGSTEPVWILNHDRDDDTDEEENGSRSENGAENEAANRTYSRPPGKDYNPYQPDRSHWAGESAHENVGLSAPTSTHYYQYHPHGHYFLAPVDNSLYTDEKETETVMKVPICCGDCEDSVRAAVYGLEGLKSVKCDIYNEKVTVVASAISSAEILMACKKAFKKSRMWSDDD